MSHAITIEQATERACQAETICRLIESYPHRFEDTEITAMASLLQRLTGSLSAWLIEEQEQRGGKA